MSDCHLQQAYNNPDTYNHYTLGQATNIFNWITEISSGFSWSFIFLHFLSDYMIYNIYNIYTYIIYHINMSLINLIYSYPYPSFIEMQAWPELRIFSFNTQFIS
jgi:hypothetical protein